MLAGRAVLAKRGVQKQVIFTCLSVFCGEAVKHMLLRNNTWVASPAVYESSVRGHASESVNYHDALGVYPVYTPVSYTHLDVYKRQQHGFGLSGRIGPESVRRFQRTCAGRQCRI